MNPANIHSIESTTTRSVMITSSRTPLSLQYHSSNEDRYLAATELAVRLRVTGLFLFGFDYFSVFGASLCPMQVHAILMAMMQEVRRELLAGKAHLSVNQKVRSLYVALSV